MVVCTGWLMRAAFEAYCDRILRWLSMVTTERRWEDGVFHFDHSSNDQSCSPDRSW